MASTGRTHNIPTHNERIEGGLLVYDALGVPYEFENVPPSEQIEVVPPPGQVRRREPGRSTGPQALCLLDSLLTCGRLDPEDLASRLLRCHGAGYLWLDGRAFDTGATTADRVATVAILIIPLNTVS